MKRNDFLKLTGISGLGIITGIPLVYGKEAKTDFTTHVESRENLWPLLGRFAFAVGAGVVSSLISDYLRTVWNDYELRNGIEAANRKMINEGSFTNFSQSQVSSHRDNIGETIAYQAITADGSNVCAPFFNLQRSKHAPVAMFEGPALAALTPIAEGLFTSKKNAANMLLPIHERTAAVGGFKEGFSRPAVYVSRGGIVRINYQSDGHGYGEAIVGISDGVDREITTQKIPIYYS